MCTCSCVLHRSACHPLAVGQVDLPEGGVEFGWWLALLVLIEEDWGAPRLQAQLLGSLQTVEVVEEEDQGIKEGEMDGVDGMY